MNNLVIIGAGGRMGKAITRCLLSGVVPDLRLVGAVDVPDCPEFGRDAGLAAGGSDTGVLISSDLEAAASQADVLIDFSFHAATADHAVRAAKWGRALVTGTTGFTEEEKKALAKAAEAVPVVMAPNMSLGVNLLFSLVAEAARALKDRGYDVEIVERHHRRKKDAPSGTALRLGEEAAEGLGLNFRDAAVHGREGVSPEERPSGQIGVHALRAGDFVGDHTVLFAAEGESIELSHRATSRDTFAIGALRAAAWVKGRPAGMYSMRDVLGV